MNKKHRLGYFFIVFVLFIGVNVHQVYALPACENPPTSCLPTEILTQILTCSPIETSSTLLRCCSFVDNDACTYDDMAYCPTELSPVTGSCLPCTHPPVEPECKNQDEVCLGYPIISNNGCGTCPSPGQKDCSYCNPTQGVPCPPIPPPYCGSPPKENWRYYMTCLPANLRDWPGAVECTIKSQNCESYGNICVNGQCVPPCTNTSWSPATSTVCSGVSFTQTGDQCGNTRSATGTGIDRTWSPATSTVCSGLSFTQTGNQCGNTRSATGTGIDTTWSPATSTVCSGLSFTQTGDQCGNTRSATGTKSCDVTPPSCSVTSPSATQYIKSVSDTITVTTTATDDYGVNYVTHPTWSSSGGQDDIIWYQDSSSPYSKVIPIGLHAYGATTPSSPSNTSYIQVYAYDTSGNIGFCGGITVIKDNTAPTCGTWAPSSPTWQTVNQTFTLSGSTDSGSGINVSGGSCLISTHDQTCKKTISDNIGNTKDCISSAAKIDKVDPTCSSWTTTGINNWRNTSITVSANCTDPTGTGSGVSGCTSPRKDVILDTNNVTVKASILGGYLFTDNAGRTQSVACPTLASRTHIDYSKPKITKINCVPIDPTKKATDTSITDGTWAGDRWATTESGVTCSVSIENSIYTNPSKEGSDVAPAYATYTVSRSDSEGGFSNVLSKNFTTSEFTSVGTDTYTFPSQSYSQNGTYTLTIRTWDDAGNNAVNQTYTFKIDTSAPTISPEIPSKNNTWYNQKSLDSERLVFLVKDQSSSSTGAEESGIESMKYRIDSNLSWTDVATDTTGLFSGFVQTTEVSEIPVILYGNIFRSLIGNIEGVHTIEFKLFDKAGHESIVYRHVIKYDKSTPIIMTIPSGNDGTLQTQIKKVCSTSELPPALEFIDAGCKVSPASTLVANDFPELNNVYDFYMKIKDVFTGRKPSNVNYTATNGGTTFSTGNYTSGISQAYAEIYLVSDDDFSLGIYDYKIDLTDIPSDITHKPLDDSSPLERWVDYPKEAVDLTAVDELMNGSKKSYAFSMYRKKQIIKVVIEDGAGNKASTYYTMNFETRPIPSMNKVQWMNFNEDELKIKALERVDSNNITHDFERFTCTGAVCHNLKTGAVIDPVYTFRSSGFNKTLSSTTNFELILNTSLNTLRDGIYKTFVLYTDNIFNKTSYSNTEANSIFVFVDNTDRNLLEVNLLPPSSLEGELEAENKFEDDNTISPTEHVDSDRYCTSEGISNKYEETVDGVKKVFISCKPGLEYTGMDSNKGKSDVYAINTIRREIKNQDTRQLYSEGNVGNRYDFHQNGKDNDTDDIFYEERPFVFLGRDSVYINSGNTIEPKDMDDDSILKVKVGEKWQDYWKRRIVSSIHSNLKYGLISEVVKPVMTGFVSKNMSNSNEDEIILSGEHANYGNLETINEAGINLQEKTLETSQDLPQQVITSDEVEVMDEYTKIGDTILIKDLDTYFVDDNSGYVDTLQVDQYNNIITSSGINNSPNYSNPGEVSKNLNTTN